MKIGLMVSLLFTILFSYDLGKDAWTVYKTNFEKNTTGIYEKDNLIYLISEIPINRKLKSRFYFEAKAMLNTKKLLKEYLAKKSPNIKNVLFKGLLGKDIDMFLEKKEYLNIKNIKTRVLVNNSNGKRLRYVVVVDKRSIKKDKVLLNEKNFKYYVANFFKQKQENKQYKKLANYYLEMGLIEDFIIFKKLSLEDEIYLKNYYKSINPFKERETLRKVLVDNDIKLEYLKIIPANKEIIDKLIKIKFENDNPAKFILKFISSTDRKIWTKFHYMSKYKNFKEYEELYNRAKKNRSTMFEKNEVLKLVYKTFGHLYMTKDIPNNQNSYFKKAKNFFDEGIKIDEIEKNLIKSIEISPRHFDSWDYLAATLVYEKRYLDALFILNQSYQINHENIETIAYMMICYSKLGYKNLANSYMEFLSMLNTNKKNNFVSKALKQIKGE